MQISTVKQVARRTINSILGVADLKYEFGCRDVALQRHRTRILELHLKARGTMVAPYFQIGAEIGQWQF